MFFTGYDGQSNDTRFTGSVNGQSHVSEMYCGMSTVLCRLRGMQGHRLTVCMGGQQDIDSTRNDMTHPIIAM